MTEECAALTRGLDGPVAMYDAFMAAYRPDGPTPTPTTGVRKLASWLPIPLMLTGVLITATGVRFVALPEPVRVDRGDRIDVYSWEGLIAAVMFTIGGLCLALTTTFDPLAPPATVMFRRGGRWIGWLVGIGGWILVWRLARILLGATVPP